MNVLYNADSSQSLSPACNMCVCFLQQIQGNKELFFLQDWLIYSCCFYWSVHMQTVLIMCTVACVEGGSVQLLLPAAYIRTWSLSASCHSWLPTCCFYWSVHMVWSVHTQQGCAHTWSAVVGPNHHSGCLTTTQINLTSNFTGTSHIKGRNLLNIVRNNHH